MLEGAVARLSLPGAMFISPPEWCSAVVIRFVGVDVFTSE